MRRAAFSQRSTATGAEAYDFASELDLVEQTSRRLGGLEPFVADVLSYDASWLLDVCCGAAELPRAVLAEARARGRLFEVVALDASDEALSIAQARTGDDRCLRYVRADARWLPFPDASFDLATLHLSMHLFEPDAAVEVLREMRRVARVSPIVCDLERSRLAALAATTLARFDGRSRPRSYDASIAIKRSYTMSELEELALQAGWEAPTLSRLGLFHIVLRDGD
jgi:ubiquinone/menaquinone biosynthesis C-methylase UbiE